jgi:hypothetical protein
MGPTNMQLLVRYVLLLSMKRQHGCRAESVFILSFDSYVHECHENESQIRIVQLQKSNHAFMIKLESKL